MSTTRDKVLKTLLTRQRCTINDLAEAVEINPISVRHHVNKLEATGLVASEEERHGVGRPRLVYFLTEKGMEKFPSRYLKLTVRLLQQLKETLPAAMVGELFSQMADDLAADYTAEMNLAELPMEERLDLVKDLLSTEGFNMEWEQKADSYHIREVSCPYLHVGQSHPEVCAVDETLISNMLAVPIEKVKCILQGDSLCTYIVPKNSINAEEIKS
ncbi:MAG: winged helix-turn-helix transcriptional regulator [Anaerolineae bacterium]|nr:winged helix-turn-helix transcriptional regulator [Anaerolineae bacterium]MBL6964912.1 winged helix-turn-helix transcriptional regulator [Anaerolineales bacterium]